MLNAALQAALRPSACCTHMQPHQTTDGKTCGARHHAKIWLHMAAACKLVRHTTSRRTVSIVCCLHSGSTACRGTPTNPHTMCSTHTPCAQPTHHVLYRPTRLTTPPVNTIMYMLHEWQLRYKCSILQSRVMCCSTSCTFATLYGSIPTHADTQDHIVCTRTCQTCARQPDTLNCP